MVTWRKLQLWLVLSALLVLSGPALAAPPSIAFGSGDTIGYVADLPANSPLRRETETARRAMFADDDNTPAVGYKYYGAYLFGMPMWTSTAEGEFVAYKPRYYLWMPEYIPLGTDLKEVSSRTGVPVSQLEIPWSARHPWGLYLLLGIILLFSVAQVNAWRSDAARRRFIDALDRLSCSDPLVVINLAAIAEETGYSLQKVRVVAAYLEGRRWVKTLSDNEGGGVLITPAGVSGAEHKRLPWWRRWMSPDDPLSPLFAVLVYVGMLGGSLLILVFAGFEGAVIALAVGAKRDAAGAAVGGSMVGGVVAPLYYTFLVLGRWWEQDRSPPRVLFWFLPLVFLLGGLVGALVGLICSWVVGLISFWVTGPGV
jgi:hypothetical protein